MSDSTLEGMGIDRAVVWDGTEECVRAPPTSSLAAPASPGQVGDHAVLHPNLPQHHERLDDPGGVSRAIRIASNGQDIVLFFAYGSDGLTAAGPLAVSRAQNVGVWWTLMLTLDRSSCAASLSECPCAFGGGIEVDGPWERPRDRRDTRPASAARRQLLRVRVYWLARFFEAGVNVLQCGLLTPQF